MFDGLLGRGFAPKGKPLIKLTKNRIDVLRRKRTATIKFLKKDLADLIINGLDVNAYNRTGGLLDELRHLWNLDFVEQTCDFVYKQLSTMQKMGECPEDCREAVSSLMFAASGFSELPELRELRQMFQEKYADSLGLFVNQELVKNMSSKPFSLENKVKLMEDVTTEFSIHWDSKAFEKRIMRDNSSSVKETPKSTYDKYKHVHRNMSLPTREEFDMPSKGRLEGFDNGLRLNRKKDDASERRDPLFQPDKESYQNGNRGNPHGLTCKERSNNARHASRSESKDNKQEPSRERHQPIFNEGDTIVMKVKRENLAQGNGHRNGAIDDAHKKTEVITSERKEFHMKSKQGPSREKHEPLFNEGDTIVMKVKRENHLHGNGHQNLAVDTHKKTEAAASEKQKPGSSKRADKLIIGFKQESFFQGYKHENSEDHASQKVDDNASRPPKSKRTVSIVSGSKHQNDQKSTEKAVLVGEKDPFGGNIKGGDSEYDHTNGAWKVEEREAERMKLPIYKSLPPPYVKPNGKSKTEKVEPSVDTKARVDGKEGNHPDIHKNVSRVERENEAVHYQVNEIDPSLKPRTSRRKYSIQSGGDENPRSRRSENSRKGLQILTNEDEKDSEEKKLDKLLMEYVKKPSSYEQNNVEEGSKIRHTHLKKDKCEEMTIHQPARSHSLPSEQFAGPSELTKTFARASSLQPEAKYVHPKLPDYDNLAARFAELKRR